MLVTRYRRAQGVPKCPASPAARSIAFMLLAVGSAHAQGSAQADPAQVGGAPVAVEVFNPPKAIDLSPPKYPWTEQVVGHEGWVHVKLMVDPQGKPYEICVRRSSGSEAFEKAAVEAVQSWTYAPARMDGKPVHAAYEYKVNFVLTGGTPGASRPFVHGYRRLSEAIAAGDKQRADEHFSKLKARNLYEATYYALAEYRYHVNWGDEFRQIASLRGAIAEEDLANYLPEEPFLAALQALLRLELKAKDFASAMNTWTKLQAHDADTAVPADVQRLIGDIALLRTDHRSYGVPGEITKSRSWYYDLFKKRFQLAVLRGQVSEIKLRCDKKFVSFKHDPDLQYRVADAFGECAIQVIGEPGTRFELIQS